MERVKTYAFLDEEHDRIKIGHSTNVKQRRQNLEAKLGRAVHTIWVVDGNVERGIHEYLDEYRIEGEWFHAVPGVTKLLVQPGAVHPDLPIILPAKEEV